MQTYNAEHIFVLRFIWIRFWNEISILQIEKNSGQSPNTSASDSAQRYDGPKVYIKGYLLPEFHLSVCGKNVRQT